MDQIWIDDVVSNFIVQALRGEDITIFESTTKRLQYVDLVEGMILKMTTQPMFLGPVNIGNPEFQCWN
jgi:UDP-glucuronate decarboxylase